MELMHKGLRAKGGRRREHRVRPKPTHTPRKFQPDPRGAAPKGSQVVRGWDRPHHTVARRPKDCSP